MSQSHAQFPIGTDDDWLDRDPEMRHSVMILRRQRTLRLVGVGVALTAAIATAFAYAYLSYNDHYESATPSAAP